jgi:thymidine phosphorylase
MSSSSSSSSPTSSTTIVTPHVSCVGDAVAMIRIRRDGLREHSDEEIEWWIQAYTKDDDDDDKVPDYQMAAWLMAICCCGGAVTNHNNPLSPREIATLTRCMVQSGRVLDWSSYFPTTTSSSLSSSATCTSNASTTSSSSSSSSSPSPAYSSVLVDKHSTGGVGDKVTIMLAPLVACLGVKVPSIAGRGLGHTGGTIDKLESIPGFNCTNLTLEQFQRIVAGPANSNNNNNNDEDDDDDGGKGGGGGGGVGCCIIAAGPDLCPADRKLYALRDVTYTVRNVGLQTASIMCKKIAERPHSLVLDCKYGRGAFQPSVEEAAELATSMLATGLANGLSPDSTAFLTRMDEPLGCAVGNWLEILECLQIMSGKLFSFKKPPSPVHATTTSNSLPQLLASIETSADLIALTCILAGQMLLQSGLYPGQTLDDLTVLALETLMEGKQVLSKFREMCWAQGGDVRVIDNVIAAATAENMIQMQLDVQDDEAAGHSWNLNDDESTSLLVSSPLFPPHLLAPSSALHCHSIRANGRRGVVTEINAMTIGLLAVDLRAGRKKEDDDIHHGTGFWLHVKVGHVVQENDVLVQVFFCGNDGRTGEDSSSSTNITNILQRVKECIVIADIENDDAEADATLLLRQKELAQQPIVTHIVTSQNGMQSMGPLPAKLKEVLYGL